MSEPGDDYDDEARVAGELADMVIDDLREIASELARELERTDERLSGLFGPEQCVSDLLTRARAKGLIK